MIPSRRCWRRLRSLGGNDQFRGTSSHIWRLYASVLELPVNYAYKTQHAWVRVEGLGIRWNGGCAFEPSYSLYGERLQA